MTYDQTVHDLAAEYVEIINGPTNAWEQQMHPKYGHSHLMLQYMNLTFGRDETHSAIARAFETYKENPND